MLKAKPVFCQVSGEKCGSEAWFHIDHGHRKCVVFEEEPHVE